jgi:hypothetical protein
MTQEQVQQVLRRITYKPGTKLSLMTFDDISALLNKPTSPPAILLESDVPNRDNPRETTRIVFQTALLPGEMEHLDERILLMRVRVMLLEWETHEAMEWFKLDGVRVHDPHAAEKARPE